MMYGRNTFRCRGPEFNALWADFPPGPGLRNTLEALQFARFPCRKFIICTQVPGIDTAKARANIAQSVVVTDSGI